MAFRNLRCIAESREVLIRRSSPQEIGRRNPRYFLEETGEVVRELEAQEVRGFAYVMAVHQEILTLFNHKNVDVTDGRATG